MERFAYKSLVEWKMSPQRKPLILRGARQVGKTWLLKEFGRREYESLIYVNCDKDAFAADLFRRVNRRITQSLTGLILRRFGKIASKEHRLKRKRKVLQGSSNV